METEGSIAPLTEYELEHVDVAAAALGQREGQISQAEVRAEIAQLMDQMSRREFLDFVAQLAGDMPEADREEIIRQAKQDRVDSGHHMTSTEAAIKATMARQEVEEFASER